MNVPLSWLSEYVTLPENVGELTDRLTMIGHMLDKKFLVDTETVIDLELRGNRADLFGFIGIARDVSAAWNVPLTFPKTEKLPDRDKKSNLITVDATDLVARFTALTVNVTVRSSPEWMVKKLAAYGMASINNVVDITNYVMLETGIPIHAFDKEKLSGKRLIIRRGKKNEDMVTFMGEKISLSSNDIVLADEKIAQATALVGSKNSGTTEQTEEILIEAAVYDQANVRRTSRRLGIRTEAGTRLEKHLDPNDVEFALSRALCLLQELADAKITSELADFYPNVRKSIIINLPISEVHRLSGIVVSKEQQKIILERLGCIIKAKEDNLIVTVPTFRTDIAEEADLVEEVMRIVGYETIPPLMLSGELPPEQTSARINQEKQIKNILVTLQLNEVITSTFVPTMSSETTIHLTNAPDPSIATLRPSLAPNLITYAHRSLNERAERVCIFEIGTVFSKHKKEYKEERRLGILIAGNTDTKSYGRTPRSLTYFDLKGVLEKLSEQLGIDIPINIETVDSTLFVTELSLDSLVNLRVNPLKPYLIAQQYPPIIEDISFVITPEGETGTILREIQSFHPLIVEAKLLDAYENKRTFRITYQDPKKNLSSEDIRPVRVRIIKTLTKKFEVHLVE